MMMFISPQLLRASLLTALAWLLSLSALAQPFNSTAPLPIAVPDNGCGSNEVEIPIEVSNVGRLNFAENKGLVLIFGMTHPYTADVSISLESPAGTRVLLCDNNGSSGDNFVVTYFVYWDGYPSITVASAPFNDYFQPEEPLTAFDGEVADGTWKVIVCDDANNDVGEVNRLSLVFNNVGLRQILAAYYPLENDLGDQGSSAEWTGTAADLTSTGSGGGVERDAFQRPGGAYAFDGSNYLEATENDLLNPGNAFTVAAWVRVGDAVSDQKIIGKATTNLNNLTIFTLAIEDNAFNFETKINGAFGNQAKLVGGTAVAGQWHHVAGTWAVNGEKRLYLNGNLVASESAGSTPFSGLNGRPLTIGAAGFNNAAHRLEGAVDEVRLYNYALTEWAVADIAQARNNYCQGAFELPVDGGSCTANRLAHNISASATDENATCGNDQGGDVWYSTVVPSSGAISLEASLASVDPVNDVVMEVFSGECRSLTRIECDDDDGADRMPLIALTGRTPGETLYVRYLEFANNDEGFWGVCAYDQNATSVPQADVSQRLTLAPNPARDGLTRLRYTDLPLGSSLRVLDATGRIVQQMPLADSQGELPLDLSQQAPGVFLLVVTGPDLRISQSLIVR